MNIYQPQHRTLSNLLEMATQDATILIPDLQRPYVWTPKQVVTLVDSLLRGWPFGSLLLWNLGPLSISEHMIPSRSFWEIVSRVDGLTDGFNQRTFSTASKPNEFFMVLDGQQRLQSLLLAFGSDIAGLRLLDRDWKISFDGNSFYKGPNVLKNWTKAELYVDLVLLKDQIVIDSDGDSDLKHDAEFDYFLKWAYQKTSALASGAQLTQNSEPKRSDKYSEPLDHVQNGRHVRLGKLWKEASFLMNKNDGEMKLRIKEFLSAHQVDSESIRILWNPLRMLIKKLQGAQNQQVQYLQLNPLNQSGYTYQDDYNIAIVNIFTRLNQGGQTLSKEEITFAWIKIQWPEAAYEIEKLRDEINAMDNKFRLETDAIIKMLSIIWCVFDDRIISGLQKKDRQKGKILRDKDLLDGKTIESMAIWLKVNWSIVSETLKSVIKIVSESDLKFKSHYYSMNALTLLAAWRITFDILIKTKNINGLEKDILLQNADALVSRVSKKWLLLSQWGGLWSKGTDDSVEKYTTRLSSLCLSINPLSDATVKEILILEIKSWMSDLNVKAKEYIGELSSDDRGSVRNYLAALEIWQNQDDFRRKQAAITLKTSNSELKKEVDHIVPYQSASKLKTEFPEIGQELFDLVNTIGNCVLITKTFNISKKDRPLDGWFNDPKFSELEAEKGVPFDANTWKSALGIGSAMSSFDTVAIKKMDDAERMSAVRACIDAIKIREQSIKDGLCAYVDESCGF